MAQNNRDLQFDIVRVLATLWIVGVWHMMSFVDTPYMQSISGDLGYVTTCMLASFMFMSGYFLSKYNFETKAEVVAFYRKRLTRFFPLFVISALLLFRLGFNPEPIQLLFTITGISSYFGHQSITIWFLSMLFSFYMATPAIVWGLEKIKYGIIVKSVVVVVFSIVFIYALSCTSLDYDIRISYTMPFYGLGLLFGKETIIKDLSSKWYVLLFSVLLLTLFHTFYIVGERFLHIDTVTAIICLLCVCYWLKYLPIDRLISVLSYASMAMYLFHRPIIHLGIKYILHDDKANLTEFYFIMMPMVVVVSYAIQYSYDFCINTIEKRDLNYKQ